MPPTALGMVAIGKEPVSAMMDGVASMVRGVVCWGFIAIITFCGASPARGQIAAFSEKLIIHADEAATWSAGNSNILELRGNVTISLDHQQCRADNAVIWLTPEPRGVLDEQGVDIVLIGHAKLTAPDDHLERTGPKLLINTIVRGKI